MKQTPIGSPQILFEDEYLVAVSKPCRMLVHRTPMDFYETENLRRWLASELGVKVDPIHRLDKPTSGVILFAKSTEVLNHIRQQFLEHTVDKQYTALVRGFMPEEGVITKPLKAENSDVIKEAETAFTTTHHIEVPIAVSRYQTSRYSLVNVVPKTGRYHQIRMHFAHLRHPIIGDSRHGDSKHNLMFRDQLDLPAMFLHAHTIAFEHPTGAKLRIHAPFPAHWTTIRSIWNWHSGFGVAED